MQACFRELVIDAFTQLLQDMSANCKITEKEIDHPKLVSFLNEAMRLKLKEKHNVKNPVLIVDKGSQQVMLKRDEVKFVTKASILKCKGWWAY